MTLQDYLNLRNGTDVRGVAVDGVKGEPITLTPAAAQNIVAAFCRWLSAKMGKDKLLIAVGHDSRISAPILCEGAVKGITLSGHDALVTGLSTTPSMFMLLKDERLTENERPDGSLMITASHLPFNRNGLKFFSENGGLEGGDIKEILTIAAEISFTDKPVGKTVYCSYLNEYAQSLVDIVRNACGETQPLKGKHIIVDAGNGAGGFYADKVLVPLGADVTGSQFLDPDGTFPNHIPNPENKEAMESVCAAVKAANADFGIIFDTDVDRAGAVDKDGSEINRNRLIALISAILLEEKKGTIVTDSVTSDGLATFIAAKGGRHHRFKRGYKNVINEAIRLNNEGEYTPLAIETSGHAALKENYFLDDGAYLITRLLIALAKAAKENKALSDLIADLEMPAAAQEIRLRFADGCDFKTLGFAMLKDFKAYAANHPNATPAPDNHEGCRVRYNKENGNGWALVRMSLHDPILPINVESNDTDGCQKIAADLYAFLKHYDFLDLSPLEKAMK